MADEMVERARLFAIESPEADKIYASTGATAMTRIMATFATAQIAPYRDALANLVAKCPSEFGLSAAGASLKSTQEYGKALAAAKELLATEKTDRAWRISLDGIGARELCDCKQFAPRTDESSERKRIAAELRKISSPYNSVLHYELSKYIEKLEGAKEDE